MKATVQITIETGDPDVLVAILRASQGLQAFDPSGAPVSGAAEPPKRRTRGKAKEKPATTPAPVPLISPAPGAGTTGVGVPPAPGAAAPGVAVPGTAAPAAITIDTLKEAVRAKVDAEGIAPVKTIISAYGATKLSDVKESDYPALLADLQGLTD